MAFASEKYYIATSAGIIFSLFTGHMSFQILLLVGHLTNWTRQNFLTHNTLKKIAQAVPRLVGCSVIVSVHNVKLRGLTVLDDRVLFPALSYIILIEIMQSVTYKPAE